jgi:hypothetical protein
MKQLSKLKKKVALPINGEMTLPCRQGKTDRKENEL